MGQTVTEKKTTFEDVIRENGRLVYTNVGDSMYPLIKPRDLLVITAAQTPLRRYDIPLYKRDSGQYVLHRIVKIRNGSYLICGDNRAWVEHGIEDRHIIGLLTGIIRNGEELPVRVTAKTRLWCASITLRKIVFRLRRIGKQRNKWR